MRTWNRTEEELPPEGQEVVIMNGPHEQTLVYERGLWWFPDRSMYVYFTPKIWHPLDEHNRRQGGRLMGVLKGPEGICQAVRFPNKLYPFCLCQRSSEPDEWYCAEHLAERMAEREKLLKAAQESAHSDGSGGSDG